MTAATGPQTLGAVKLHHEPRTHWHSAFQSLFPGEVIATIFRFVAWAAFVGALLLMVD